MHKLIISLLCGYCLFIAGCSLYQPNIQQGNYINQKMLSQIHLGMSKQQVANVLGFPVLDNAFNPDTWPYVYTFQKNGKKITKQYLNLYFVGDRLVRISGDYKPF